MAKTSRALGLLPHWHLGSLSIKALVAECMAATLFVYIGTGTATTFSATEGFSMAPEAQGGQTVGNVQADVSKLTNNVLTNGSWGVTTALAFGLAITVMAYATGHLSGGQINPAVSLSLFVAGLLGMWQAIGNICAQLTGAILASALLYATVPNPGVSTGNALCGEIVMTFVLVSVVLEVATNKNEITRSQSPLAIGFAVVCAHAVLLPIDGCSINPARSFGPAVVAGKWAHFYVFVAGPSAGGLLAVPFHMFFNWGGGKAGSDPLALPGDRPGSKPGNARKRSSDPLAMEPAGVDEVPQALGFPAFG